MSDRPYLSIGEVLALVQQEFPDVTISKIRFLESQGLLDPERTPSGYRKFYPADVDRLRWILREQREHFLPLKVIKDRLNGVIGADDDGRGSVAAHAGATPGDLAQELGGLSAGAGRVERLPAWMVNRPPSAGPLLVPDSDAPSPAPAPAAPDPPVAVHSAGTAATRQPVVAARPPATSRRPFDTGASFTVEELATAAGLTVEQVRNLHEHGLVRGQALGGATYYDEEALVVAKLAAGFARYGIEPRHLRLYRMQAEREGSLFEQVVMPLLKQRNPDARRRAADAVADLSAMGERLRRALLDHELREFH